MSRDENQRARPVIYLHILGAFWWGSSIVAWWCEDWWMIEGFGSRSSCDLLKAVTHIQPEAETNYPFGRCHWHWQIARNLGSWKKAKRIYALKNWASSGRATHLQRVGKIILHEVCNWLRIWASVRLSICDNAYDRILSSKEETQ